jgi:tetratricopeptide (TPR) repeat protein
VCSNRGFALRALERGPEAFRSNEKAADCYRALHRDVPARKSEFQYRLGVVLSNMGDLCRLGGQLQKAQELLHEAQALFRQLPAGLLDQVQVQAGQARLHCYLGALSTTLGNDGEACLAYEQTCKFHEKLSQKYPQSLVYQFRLARDQRHLGEVLVRRGQAHKGLLLLQRSQARLDQLVEANPDVVQYVVDWAVTQWAVGERLLAANDRATAQQCYQRLHDRLMALKTRHEGSASFLRMLAYACYVQGAFALEHKDMVGGLALLERSRQIRQQLVKGNPTRLDYRADLASSLLVRGQERANAGKFDEAIASVREAIDQTTYNLVAAPRAPAHARMHLKCFGDLVQIHHAAGQHDRAFRCWQEVCDLFARLVRQHGQATRLRIYLAQALMESGMDLARHKRPGDAVAQLSLACREWERLLGIDAKESLGGQANCHFQIGLSYLDQNNLEASEDSLRKAIVYQRRVLDAAPERADQRKRLALVYQNLAIVLHKAGKREEAEAATLQQQQLTDQAKDQKKER